MSSNRHSYFFRGLPRTPLETFLKESFKTSKNFTTERTTVKTRDGRTHNGSLLYTLCPLAPVEQAYFEKQIREASARLNFKAALEKYEKRKGGA